MRVLEDANGPEHLVVFITSDQDFCEKVQELQRRNFKVVVLYCKAVVSAQPVSISNAADEAYEWLPFLQQRVGINLTQLAGHEVKQNKQEPAAAQHASETLGHEVKQDKREPAAAQDVSKTVDIELRSGRTVKKVQVNADCRACCLQVYVCPVSCKGAAMQPYTYQKCLSVLNVAHELE